MLAALQIGVKGGKWHSLIDKVSRFETLGLGWAQVERNAGAADVDRMSVERFAQGLDADDAVVLCRSREEAESALARMRAWVGANGLTLHPDKTHVGDCRVEGQGFEFLGYRFEAGQRWVRKKSLMSLRDRIRAKTKRNGGHSVDCVIASLNPTLKGWYGYFKHAHRFTFSSIDGFVRRRLRAMLRRQKHRPGQGRCLRDHKQWPNAFFADLGLFTMSEAHRLARQSR